MLGQGRWLSSRLGEARHVHLTAGDEQAQDHQALLVGEEAEQTCRVAALS